MADKEILLKVDKILKENTSPKVVSGSTIILTQEKAMGAFVFTWLELVVDMMNMEKGLTPEMNLFS